MTTDEKEILTRFDKPDDWALVRVSTGIAAFPKDIVPIIRSQAEKYFNVVRFNEFSRGGTSRSTSRRPCSRPTSARSSGR